MGGPARIVIRRTVGWGDTDASGHYQFQTVFRWVMEAEGELHLALGIAARTQGSSPRLHVEADYLARLWFGDRVDIGLTVERVGKSSLRYAFTVHKLKELAARGAMVVAYLPKHAKRPQPWPDDLRRIFLTAGERRRASESGGAEEGFS